VIVALLGGKATGAITGAWMGIYAALLLAIVQSRSMWLKPRPAATFDWRWWLRQILPLTIGLGAGQFIFSVDMIFVRAFFGEDQTGYYSASGMIGRGLVTFTAPLAAVMFPKIVHNLAHGKKSNLLVYTLAATFVLGALAATVCTGVAMGIRHLLDSAETVSFVPAAIVAKIRGNPVGMRTLATLIPWFVWCMLPLACANVLLNNLMAQRRYRVVLYLALVVVSYSTALALFTTDFVRVIQILGIFNVIYLAVLAVFTRIEGKREQS
jgi:hypothetical protein